MWLASWKKPNIGQNLKYKLNRIKLNRLINAKCNAAITELKTMPLLFFASRTDALHKRKKYRYILYWSLSKMKNMFRKITKRDRCMPKNSLLTYR